MCGILGVVGGLPKQKEVFEKALATMIHRGPDDEGIYLDSEIIVGMRRLSIIDIKNGAQPSYSPDRQIVTVFNGEIYNFEELRRSLEKLGHSFVTQGETEIITHLYMEYGKKFVVKLDGMFAIAIWDRSKRTLQLYRDRLGEKPLWFSEFKNGFFFSSEIKALLKLGLPKIIRKGLIQDTLNYGYSNSPYSPFESIFQLKPGNMLTYCDGNLEIETYWSPLSYDVTALSDAEALTVFDEIFRAAISKRMLSERPIGVFLSGGVDSSLVAAYAASLSPTRLNTFSVGFEDTKFDESPYARRISQILDTNHNELIVKPDPTTLIEDLASILDQPFADSSVIPTLLLSQFARENCVVALGGDGGDEVFGGYNRYRYLMQVSNFFPIIPKKLLRTLHRMNLSDKHSRIIRTLATSNLESAYNSMQTLIPGDLLSTIVNPEFIHSNFTNSSSQIWQTSKVSLLRKMQLTDLTSYLPGDLLYKADMATMAASLELRSPFLDHKLVEFGIELHDNIKFRESKSKWILKQALRNYLPSDLIDRPKQGFGIPRAEWLRGPFNEVARELLLGEKTRDRNWFKIKEIQRIVNFHESGKNRDSTLWPLMILELWARRWLDAQTI
jgi:asparagine synthase (glutamine-hydrolysing)